MNQGITHRVSVSPQKVAEMVFQKIFPAMQGSPLDAMVLSLICAAALAVRPDIDHTKLQQVVLDVSGHLMMQLQDEVPLDEAN